MNPHPASHTNSSTPHAGLAAKPLPAPEIPDDIASKLVRVVSRSRNLVDVLALSCASKQFRRCSQPVLLALSPHQLRMREGRKAWRAAFRNADDPAHRSFMLRAAARDTLRLLSSVDPGKSSMLVATLHFLAPPRNAPWRTDREDAPAAVLDGLGEKWLADRLCEAARLAPGAPGGLANLDCQLDHRVWSALRKSTGQPYAERLALMMATLELFRQCLHSYDMRDVLVQQLPGLSLNDQVRLAHRMMGLRVGRASTHWINVLEPVKQAIADKSLFDRAEHPQPAHILWSTFRTSVMVFGKDATDWLQDVLDNGLHEQLQQHPHVAPPGRLDGEANPQAQDAPWPLILVAWLCQLRLMTSAGGDALMKKIGERIASKEYRFLYSEEFRRLTKHPDIDPVERLVCWLAGRKIKRGAPGMAAFPEVPDPAGKKDQDKCALM
ncbi:hypothetical protein [Lacisediminimonas profundi]|uniref:hypothetical protein n=1 Tax=Lacisediminimonas profundi TaxID=2603856 RepID=UPI00124B1C3B|nr:hypothetical protein [Lacisediminimonas profundi]